MILIILFLSILLCFCFAQEILNVEIELPEITELTYDEIELQNWQVSTPDADLIHFKPVIKLQTRHNYQPDNDLLTSRLIFSATNSINLLSPVLNGIAYQKLQKINEPVNLYQLGLTLHPQSFIKTVTIGSFRLYAGEGLCLGSYNTPAKNKSNFIYSAQGLSHPALTGFTTQFHYKRIDLVGWASQTSRIAILQDNLISRLYESSLTITDNKDTTPEKTAGVIVASQHKNYHIGALYYHQAYNYDWSEAPPRPIENLVGIFADYNKKPIQIGAEVNLANEKTAQALNFRYQSKAVSQNLRYFLRPNWQKPSYSKTQQIFGQTAGNQEISWDISYKPMQRLTLSSRIAAFRDLINTTDTAWKERLIFAAKWHEKDWQSGLTWYRYRKTAIPVYDTLQTDLLPTQNRIRADWAKQITIAVQFSVTCQYQHYLDQKITKNGFSLQQGISYNTKPLDFEVSFLSWTNQKSLYQPTELLTYDELLLQSDSDTAFRANVKYNFSKNLSLNLSAYRPNKRVSRQSYWLNLHTTI